jgi:hypothetical protein
MWPEWFYLKHFLNIPVQKPPASKTILHNVMQHDILSRKLT